MSDWWAAAPVVDDEQEDWWKSAPVEELSDEQAQQQRLLPPRVFREAEEALRKRPPKAPELSPDEQRLQGVFFEEAYQMAKAQPGKFLNREDSDYSLFATRAMQKAGLDVSSLKWPQVRDQFAPILDAFDALEKYPHAGQIPKRLRSAVLEASIFASGRERQESPPGFWNTTGAGVAAALGGVGTMIVSPFRSREETDFEQQWREARLGTLAQPPADEGFLKSAARSIFVAGPQAAIGGVVGGPGGMALTFGGPTAMEVSRKAREGGASELAAAVAGGTAGTVESFLFGGIPGYKGLLAGISERVLSRLGGQEGIKATVKTLLAKYALESATTGTKISAAGLQSQLAKDMAIWASGKDNPKAGEELLHTIQEFPKSYFIAALLHVPSLGFSLSRSDAKVLGIPEDQARDAPSRQRWLQEHQARLWAKVPVQTPSWAEEKPYAEQVPKAGPPDGGRGTQPILRQEGGGPPEGRQGVQPGGQGDRYPPKAPPQEEVVGGEPDRAAAAVAPPAEAMIPVTPPPEEPRPAPIQEPPAKPKRQGADPWISRRAVAEYATAQGLDPELFQTQAEEIQRGINEENVPWRKLRGLLYRTTINPREIRRLQNELGGDYRYTGENSIGRKLKDFDVKAERAAEAFPEYFRGTENLSEQAWQIMIAPRRPRVRLDDPKILEATAERLRPKTAGLGGVPGFDVEQIKVNAQLEQLPLPERAKAAREDFVSALNGFGDRLRSEARPFSLVDPAYLIDIGKIVYKAAKAGVLTFAEFVEHAGRALGDHFNQLRPAFVEKWNELAEKSPEIKMERAPIEEAMDFDWETGQEIRRPVIRQEVPPPVAEPPSPAKPIIKPEATKPTPEPGGPTEVPPEPPARPGELFKRGEPPDGYSIKNAAMEQLTGRPEPPTRPKTSWPILQEEAAAKPAAEVEALVKKLRADPNYAATPEENALLLQRVVDIAGDLARERDSARSKQLDDQLAELQLLSKRTGERQSEALRSRQMEREQDYSEGNQLALLREAKGAIPSPEERDTITKETAKIQELERKAELLKAKPAIDEIVKEAKPFTEYEPRVKALADKIVDWLNKQEQSAIARIKARHAATGYAGLDPRDVADLVTMGAARMGRGLVTFAKWSADLAEAVKDWIRPDDLTPHLKEIWEASENQLDRAIDGPKGRPKPPESKKPQIKQAIIERGEKTAKEETPDTIGDKIRKRFERDSIVTVAMTRKLAKALVEDGITDREQLVDAVHGILATINPEQTRRQTIGLIAGEGQYHLLPKDPVSVSLRGIVGELQQIVKIQEMEAGRAGPLFGGERRTPTDAERWLIDQVKEMQRRGGFVVTDPKRQAKSALDFAKHRIRNQMADLEQEITTKQRIVKKQGGNIEADEELGTLQAALQETKKAWNEVFNPPEAVAKRKSEQYTRTLEKRLADLDDRIGRGDFAKKPVVQRKLEKEQLDLLFWIDQKKSKLMAMREEAARNRNIGTKTLGFVRDLSDLSWAVMTGLEMSAILRQGAAYTLGFPEKAIPAVMQSVMAAFSRKAEYAIHVDLSRRANAADYRAGKLETTASEGPLSAREELFRSRILDWMATQRGVAGLPLRVPAEAVLASARAFRTFCNVMRADLFDYIKADVEKGRKWTEDDPKAAANAANVFGGRATIKQSGEFMRLFFAPRWVWSRVKLAIGEPVWNAPKGMRMSVAKIYVRWAIGAMALFGIRDALYRLTAKDEEHKPKYETDPRSSDFGKMRVGRTRVELGAAGLHQLVTLGARLVTGTEKKPSGKIVPIGGPDRPYGARDAWDVITDFGRGKLAPLPSAVIDYATGETAVHEPATIPKIVGERFSPMTWQDIFDAEKELGIIQGTVAGVDAFLGTGVNTYQPRTTAPKRLILKPKH